MTCTINEWITLNWHRCIFDPTVSLIGEGLFGLIVGVGIWAGLYFAGGGSPTTPTVVTILVATLLFPLLPGGYVGIAWSILVIGSTGAIIQALQKYVLNPSTV